MIERFEIYIQACTHSSYSREHNVAHNEKLELLGDSVLQLLITEMLLEVFPQESEGNLSQMRHTLVNNKVLALCAKSIQLGALIRLGKGEERTGGRTRERILANTFEACLGAVYLDKGLEPARIIIKSHFTDRMKKISYKKPKQKLHEWSQKNYHRVPEYFELEREGPPHALIFHVAVRINDKQIAVGEGKSFKDATNNAASIAVQRLGIS